MRLDLPMCTRLTLRVTAALVILASVLVSAPPARAGTGVDVSPNAGAGSPGCVTQAEFEKVRLGMTPRQVSRILGTAGQTLAGFSLAGDQYMVKSYDPCRKAQAVTVDYKNRKVRFKVAYWGLQRSH